MCVVVIKISPFLNNSDTEDYICVIVYTWKASFTKCFFYKMLPRVEHHLDIRYKWSPTFSFSHLLNLQNYCRFCCKHQERKGGEWTTAEMFLFLASPFPPLHVSTYIQTLKLCNCKYKNWQLLFYHFVQNGVSINGLFFLNSDWDFIDFRPWWHGME